MKRTAILSALILFGSVTIAAAASTKTYQVTGPVIDVKDDMIVVEKGKERWEIARDKDTPVTGDLKVGEKVTVEYRMAASKIEVKTKGAMKGGKGMKGEMKGK